MKLSLMILFPVQSLPFDTCDRRNPWNVVVLQKLVRSVASWVWSWFDFPAISWSDVANKVLTCYQNIAENNSHRDCLLIPQHDSYLFPFCAHSFLVLNTDCSFFHVCFRTVQKY